MSDEELAVPLDVIAAMDAGFLQSLNESLKARDKR